MMHRRAFTHTVICAALMLGGCAAGPDYKKPALDMPAAWKVEAPWRESAPNDTAPKGPWWQTFADAQLDALITEALAGSPTLSIANARLAQARASLSAATAGQYPQAAVSVRGVRQRITGNRPLTNYNAPNFSTTQNDVIGALAVNYEADLSGRIQRTVEGARASA